MSTLYVGSSQTYQTIADAVAAAQAGDTIIVKGSEYTSTTEEVVINKSLTLQAEGDVTVNYIALGDDSNTYASPIDISVSGFTIKPTVACDSGRYRGIWQHSQGVKSVAIADCNIDLTDVAGENSGILMSYSSTCAMEEISITDCTITGNTVDGTTRNGIYIGDKASLSSMTITGNTVSGTFRDAIGADFSRLSGSTEYTVNISNNNISDSRRDGIQFGGVVSTGATIIANDNTISNVNNAQCGSGDGAIAFHSGSTTAGSVTISGNNISDAQVGVAFCNMASTATTVTNNTIAYTEKNTGDDNVTAAGITGYTAAETDNNTVMELASADNIIVDADITGNAGDVFEYNGKAYVIGTNAFTTIEAAVAAAADGATVLITAGEYSEVINYASKGNKNNVTITGETDAEGNSLVNWTGSLTLNKDGATWKDITLSNINFINTTGSGACVSLKECYRWTFENCSFDSTAHNGAYGWNPISFPSGANGNNGHTISNCSLTGGSISVRVGNDATAGYGLKVVGCTILNTNFNIQAGGTYDVIFENNDITIEYDDATLAARAEKDNAFIVAKSDVTTANIIITGGTLSMVGDQVPVIDKGWTAIGLYKDFAGTVNISGVTIKNETENSFVSNFSNTASSVTANVDASGNTFVDANDNVVTDANTIANEILNLKNGNIAVDYSNYSATSESAAAGNYNGHKVVVYTEGGVVCAFVDGVAVDASKLYVNSAWSGKQNGEIVGDGHIYGYNAFSSFAAAAAKIKTDGSNTTIKILNDQNLDSSIEFDYGTGDVLFTADSAVTVKQNKNGLDLAFTKSVATNVIIDKNVTFEISDNSAGIYLYYGPCLTVNGTITGGANWGCLYLFNGTHTVSETGSVEVGRVQLGFNTFTIAGSMDTNYLLVEGGTFNANNAIIDANVIYDNNNGGQRWGASEFNINNSKVTTSKLTLSYADSVMNVTGASDIKVATLTGNGTINFTDAALDADTVINTDKTGSSVGNTMVFRGDNIVSGSKIYTGWNKNLYVGDWNGADASASLNITDGAELIFGGAAYIGTDAEDKGASANKVTVAGATFAGHGGDGSLYLRRDGELEVKDNALASFSYVRLKGAANVSNADFEAININFSGTLNAEKANITVSGNITEGTGAITLSNGSVLSVSDIIFGTALNIDLATPIKFDHTQAQILVADAGGTNNVFTQSLKAGQTSINLFTNLPLGSYTVTIWAQEADYTKTELYSGIPADITTHGSLSMDFTSQLKFSGDLNVPQGSITVDASAYTAGTYKLFNYTGSDIANRGEAYYRELFIDTAWNDKYVVVNGDLLITDQTANTVYVNSAYTGKQNGDITADGKIIGYNAAGSFESALEFATGNGSSRIELMGDINDAAVVNPGVTHDIAAGQNLTIGTVSGATATVDINRGTGTYSIYQKTNNSSLTIEDGVTLKGLDIVTCGFATSGNFVTINGRIEALSLKEWTSNGGITVNETGSVWLGYGDGQLDLAYGNGYLTVNGTLTDTSDTALGEAQLKAGYSGTRGNGNTLNLNNTYMEAGAWFTVAGSNGTFNIKNSVLKVYGGDASGYLTVSSSGNVFNLTDNSRLVVAQLTLNANNTINAANSSLELKTVTNSGEISVENSTFTANSVDNSGTFNVAGTSELHIDTLTGKIDLDDGAVLKNSKVGGSVYANGDVEFEGGYTGGGLYLKGNVHTDGDINVSTFGVGTAVDDELKKITNENNAKIIANSVWFQHGKFELDTDLYTKNLNLSYGSDTTIKSYVYSDGTGGDNLTYVRSTDTKVIEGGTINSAASIWIGPWNHTAKLSVSGSGSEIRTEQNLLVYANSEFAAADNAAVYVGQTAEVLADGVVNINGATFTANSVANSGTFNVGGTSELHINTLTGTVDIDDGATVKNSNVGGAVRVDGGEVAFDGANTVASIDAKNGATVNINAGDSLNVTGSRTKLYNETINITGEIADALTADKSALAASLKMKGMSLAGYAVENDTTVATLNVTNAYVDLSAGDLSSKPDANAEASSGTYELNLTNSIMDVKKVGIENQSKAKFDINLDGSIINASGNFVMADKDSEMTLSNGSIVNINSSFKSDGTINILSGSKLIANNVIQPSENAGMYGTVNVDNAELELLSSGNVIGHAVVNEGNINLTNSAKAKVNFINNSGTVNVTGSTFTATGKVTNSGTVNVSGADAFVNANSVAGTGKFVMTDVTLDDRWNISGTQGTWQFLGDNTISKEVDLNGNVYFGTLIAGEPIADADKALVEASVNTISADVNFDMARVGASMYDVVDGKYAELNINNNAVANIGYMQIRESGKVNITDGATVISNASSTNLKGILNIDGGTYNSVGGSVAKNAVITISNYGQWIDDPGNGSMDFAAGAKIQLSNNAFFSTTSWYGSAEITMDHTSKIVVNVPQQTNIAITVDTTGYTGGTYLIADFNKAGQFNTTSANTLVFNNDLYVTDQDNSILYVNNAYTGSVGDITADGKIIGYNAFDNVKAAVNKANELSGGTVNLLDTPYAYAAPLISDANALTITNAGNYTITGGNGALLNYEWEINPDKLAGDYNVTIDDAFVTLTKFTLRDNADVTVTDSRLDFNPFLSGSWFSVYRDSKLTVSNSTIGYNPSKTGVADPDDFLAAPPAADSTSYKWNWGTVLQVYGDAEFTNSTLFLTDNEGGHSNFSVKGNGNVTFTNSYISNALFNVGFGGVDSKYFGSGDDINNLNAKLTISGSTIRNTQYRGDNASSGIRVGEGNRAGTLVITNSDIDMTVVKYTDGNEYGLTVYNGSVTVTNSKVSVSKFANSGTVSLTGSTLTTGAVTNSGNINIGVADGKLSVFSGTTLTNSGTITIDVTGYTGGEYKVIDLDQTTALSGLKLVDNDKRTSAGYNKKYVLRYAADGDVYVSTRPTTLYVNSDYNSSTEGYGYDKFNNYQSALNFAIASGDTQFAATIVIEKTTTISGNCIDHSTHKNLSNLDVVIQDGATMGNANSKWDMTYAVTIEGGGILQSARPKSAGVGYAHLKNALVIGEEGSTKKAYLHFLSDAYQDIDISIRYNGSLTAYNADITVQDLDAQGSMTLNDSTVYVEGALATASSYKTTLTNTTMTVGGTLISGGISDFAGGTANQLGRVTMTDSSITFGNDSTVNVKGSVSMTDSDIVADIFNVGNTLTLTESTLDVGALTITSAGKLTMDIESTVAFKTYSGSKKITVSNISSFNSGAYKLLDYTGSGSYDEAGYRNVINWNDNFTVFNNDLYLTKETNNVLYVNGAYTGNVGDITANGKIIGYNAFENLGDALKNADGKTVMVETADRTLEGVTAWDDMSTAYTGDFTLDAANDPTDVKFYKNNLFVGDITFNENVNIVLTSGAKLAFGDRSNVDAANAHTYTVNGTIITDGGNTAYVYVRNHRETVNLNGKIDIAFYGNGQVYNKGTMTVTGTGKGYGADNYQLKSDYMLISGVNDNGVRLGGVLNLVDTAVKVGTLQLSNGDDELYSAITATNSTLDIGAFRYGNGNIKLTGSVLNYTNTPVQASENHGLSANGTLDLVNSTMNVTNGAFKNAGKVTLTGNAALNGDIELNGTAARLNFGTESAKYTGGVISGNITLEGGSISTNNPEIGQLQIVNGDVTITGNINGDASSKFTVGGSILNNDSTAAATLTLQGNTVNVGTFWVGAGYGYMEAANQKDGRFQLIVDGAVLNAIGGGNASPRNTGSITVKNAGKVTSSNSQNAIRGNVLVTGEGSEFNSRYTNIYSEEDATPATLTYTDKAAGALKQGLQIGHSSKANRTGLLKIDNYASVTITSNDLTVTASGAVSITDNAALTIAAGKLTNAGTVEMDYTSKLTFSDTITVADGGSFSIDLTGYTSGIYKVIDYTGSTADVDYSFVNGGNMNNLVSVGGDLYVYNGNSDTIYVNAAYDYETAKADGLLYGYNAAGSFESALEFAIGNGSSRIELMGDINDAAVVNPDVTHNIAAGQHLTIGTVSGATATVDINRGAETYSIYQMTGNSSLTIEDGVTLKGLDVIACGFFTSGNFLTIDGRIEALSLKEWTSNGGITVNETGSVWLGYGDGQLDLAYGNGYLTVNGTLTDTSDAALGEAQLKAGYSGTRGNGNTLNLNNTYMEAGAWFNIEGSNGTFNIKNSVLKVYGGDASGYLTVSSSGNVFNLTDNSRLVVAQLTLNANNTINAANSSLELKTITNSGTVNVTNGVITADSVINNDKFYVNDTIFTATSMTNNTGDFIINGGTVAIGTLTNPASGRTKVTGETLIKIDNLSGANSMWLMDDAVLLEDSAIYGLTVRAVGDTVTFGKADNGSDGTITVTEFDNRFGYAYDTSGSQAGQELVINDTMNVTGTWLSIFGANTDGDSTVVNGNGKIVANNSDAILQNGKIELNVDVETGRHLRFTNTDITITGTVSATVPDSVRPGQLTALQNANVTVDGGTIDTAHHLLIGYDTYIGNNSVSDAYKSTLTLKNGGVVETDYNLYLNKASKIVANNGTLTVGGNAYTYAESEIALTNSTFTAGSVTNKGKISVEGATFTANSVDNSGDFYITGTSTINAELASGNINVYSATLSGNIENNANLYLTDTTFKANVTGKGNFYVYGDTEIDGDISVEAGYLNVYNNATLNIASGNKFTFTGNSSNTNCYRFVFVGGNLDLDGELSIENSATRFSGANVNVADTAVVNAEQHICIYNSDVTINGEFNVTSVSGRGEGIIIGHNSYDYAIGTSSVKVSGSSAKLSVADCGTTVALRVYSHANGSGSLTVEDGAEVNIGGIVDNSGTITVDNANFSARKIVNSGDLYLTNAIFKANVTGAGNFIVSGNVAIDSAYSVENGSLTVNQDSALTVAGSAEFATVENNGTITVDWTASFAFANIINNGTFTVDLTGYKGDAAGKVVLDHATGWTAEQYKALLGDSWNDAYFTVNADGDLVLNGGVVTTVYIDGAYSETGTNDGHTWGVDAFNNHADALAKKPQNIIVSGGTFTTSSGHNGSTAVIEAGSFGNVYAGGADGSVVSDSTSLTIKAGSFNNVYGGSLVKAPLTINQTSATQLAIKDGSFGYDVIGGDYVRDGIVIRESSNLTISGGTFSGYVAGGMKLNTQTSSVIASAKVGDVNFTITGGTFTKRVYGGNFASNYAMSHDTAVTGNINLVIDATQNDITFGEHIVGGSYAYGKVEGDVRVTFSKAADKNISFAANSIVLGGSDNGYTVIGSDGTRTPYSFVYGERTVAFDSYSGDFGAAIKMFSDIDVTGNSNVNFTSSFSFADISDWDIEFGSSLSGIASNDFTGDTIDLDLTGFDGNDWTVMVGTENALSSFDNATLTFSGAGADQWIASGYGLKLEDTDDGSAKRLVFGQLA